LRAASFVRSKQTLTFKYEFVVAYEKMQIFEKGKNSGNLKKNSKVWKKRIFGKTQNQKSKRKVLELISYLLKLGVQLSGYFQNFRVIILRDFTGLMSVFQASERFG
jgi:hypothetical protein